MKFLIIGLVLLISLNNVECGSKMAKLLAKASMRTFKRLAYKSAKSFIADSLFSGIGSRSHGNTTVSPNHFPSCPTPPPSDRNPAALFFFKVQKLHLEFSNDVVIDSNHLKTI